jgi:hypothetical protein
MVSIKVGMSKMRSLVFWLCLTWPLILVSNTMLFQSRLDAEEKELWDEPPRTASRQIALALTMHRIRSHGTKRVETLSDEELLVVSLSLTSRHIIQHDRTPDVIRGVLLLDADTTFANNHAQLAFIV